MDSQLTTSQKKGITITDRDLCVVAGPGSGKTRVLVERFANLVIEHKVPINEILTLTFTEKAANEMKIRAARLFEQKGMEKECQEIEFAYLSTIHSFCSRLLRENAIEAGIDPQFSVMDELEAGRVKEQTLEDTLKKWAQEKSLDTFLNDIFWKHPDSRKSRLKSFKENLILLYEKIRNSCVPISETVNTDDLSQDIVNSKKMVEELINEINEIRSEKKLSDKTRDKVENVLERWNTSYLQNDINKLYNGIEKPPQKDDLILALLNKVKGIHSYINLAVSKDVKQPLRALREELKILAGLLAKDYSTRSKMVLRDFLMSFDIAYSERKKVESLIDFTDLEVETIELLKNKKYIANEIKQKFKYILVDEFQDISRLQKTIIDLIRSKNNLFIVGDEKQSIYGFRNAEVEIFQDIQKDSNRESLISLDENFRSRSQILDFINNIFNQLWPVRHTGLEETHIKEIASSMDSTQLKAGAEFSDKPFPSVEIIVAEGKDKTEARKWESMDIAKRIKEIVDKGEIWITNKREPGKKLSYRDFAILFRSTTDIKLYEHSLSHLDVPYYVVSGRGFFNTTEITDLINLLKVIESPLDEINLASVLKSPFVGIDDEALFRLADYAHARHKFAHVKQEFAHDNKGRKYLYQILNEVGLIKEIKAEVINKITQFLQLLREIQDIKHGISLWHLISFILKRTEFQSKMLLFSNGKRRYANLLKLVELCRGQEEFGPMTLKDFIEIVEGYKFREIRESEAPVESEEDDVVKLITTHSAKGLEFPVVIIADTDRDNSRPSDYFVYSKTHGISFKILNPLTNEAEEPLCYKRINDEAKEKELQESKRLLFVAMTRAQEHLIISGGINKSRGRGDNDKGNWHRYLSSSLSLKPELEENPEIIKLDNNKYWQNSSQTVEIKHTRIKEENKPSARDGTGGSIEGKKTKLLTQYKKEIAACNTINTPPPSEDIINTGKKILSTIKHTVPVDDSHYVYSVTEILKFHFCPQLYYFTYILGLPRRPSGSRDFQMEIQEIRPGPEPEEDINKPHNDEIPGSELGNIAHQVFERYNLIEGKEILRDIIKSELEASGFDIEKPGIEHIEGWVNSFYESEVGREVASSTLQKRETSFIFQFQDNLIRGQIDLIYLNKEGMLKIVDYKSNNINAEEIPEKVKYYKLQMQLYAKALEAVYEKEIEEAVLYFLVPNKPVIVDTTEESCKGLYKTLEDFFYSHGKGNFKQARKHKCQWCEYEELCKK